MGVLTFLTNFVVVTKRMALFLVEWFCSKLKALAVKLATKTPFEEEVTHHARFFVSNLLDIYDYSIRPPTKYQFIPKEKTISIFKDITNSVSLDIEIEGETIGMKVLQVSQQLTVAELYTQVLSKFQGSFKDFNSLTDAFWFCIHIRDEREDVQVLQYSSVVSVRHLLNWYKSLYGNENVSLVVRRRVYCGRSIYDIEKLGPAETAVNFTTLTRIFLNKGWFTKSLKEEKLVEIFATIYFLRFKNEDHANSQKTSELRQLEIQKLLTPDLLRVMDTTEWTKKVSLQLNKAILSKRPSELSLKKKVLTDLRDCLFCCSAVYDYNLHRAKDSDLNAVGKITVNVHGVYFYNKGNYRQPSMGVFLGNVCEFEYRGSKVKFKYMHELEVKTVFLEMSSSKQFCEDIASFMMLGLRENRHYFYSYAFLAKFLPPTLTPKERISVEQLHNTKIAKCLDYLNSIGDMGLNFSELPFTSQFYTKVTKQNFSGGSFYNQKHAKREAKDRPKDTSFKKQGLMKAGTKTSISPFRQSAMARSTDVMDRDN